MFPFASIILWYPTDFHPRACFQYRLMLAIVVLCGVAVQCTTRWVIVLICQSIKPWP